MLRIHEYNCYLPRSLADSGKTYTETELTAASNYVVVLAEPGGGKTELMKSLAQQLGTSTVTANVFVHMGADTENCPLVIDAFDELAKVDQTGINRLLANARKANPTHVIISSRSSEWNSSNTHAFKDFFEHSPLVVRLREFNKSEQREIFSHYLPGEDFSAFQAEVARFDLEMLLPNPKFLELFADAYIESGRHFTDKQSIFKQAIEHLAKEANTYVASLNPTLSITQKIDISSEVFTKLLLSGAEGLCTSEATENRMYPSLALLSEGNAVDKGILATRLFKPGNNANQHRPVHKIVAEYCAADYLTKQIADPASPLTLSKCLPIIAPNSTVRDELRGLLGWMAALGNGAIQKSVIELDPYAVLANGDPSQLEHSSKRLLVKQLKEIEKQDPHFQRGDFWRQFSIVGFFTQDVIEEIKPILTSASDGHLRNLILRLLAESPAVKPLRAELRQITLAPTESDITRSLANRCLLNIGDDGLRSDLNVFVSEASDISLSIAAEIIENLGLETFEKAYLKIFLRTCAQLYPGHLEQNRRASDCYFIERFIYGLDLMTIEWLLDELTKDITCSCGKDPHECYCRNGISQIVGSILDRYFELATPPFNPVRIWKWVENLNFQERTDAACSKSVQVLQQNDELRQGVIAHVFGALTDRDKIHEIRVNKFNPNSYSHPSLTLQGKDYEFIVDLAFETDNPILWVSFMAGHQHHRKKEKQGPDNLRHHMRDQALQKSLFMREWARNNRAAVQLFKRDGYTRRSRGTRKIKRRRRKEDEIRIANIKYVQDNRKLVENGRHWTCLVRFAELVLKAPDKIVQEFGDEAIVRTALRNCLDFIEPKVPDLPKLAELNCTSQHLHSEMILYAACSEIMRAQGNLEEVNLRLLRALRTNINMSYGGAISGKERIALFKEVDRLVFHDNDSGENFLRQYVEPQMAHPECAYPPVGLLGNEEVFSHLRSTLSIEWLKRFHELKLDQLNALFEIAAQYGNRDDLREIIAERCAGFMSDWPTMTEDEKTERRRTFWLVRAWYFLNDLPEAYWNWLKADKNTVLVLYELSSRINRGTCSYWPKLTSNMIEAILDAFIDKWPKVDLPNSWGSGSPKGENAYRFLTEVIWSISSDNPDDAIPVLERLLADSRFSDLQNNLKSIYAEQLRKRALRDFEPPTPQEIVNLLDCDAVATVESLRQLVLQELQDFQRDIDGGEFNSADRFYEKGDRLGEVRSTEIIAERLNLRLKPKGISVTPEHQLKGANRSDFTITKMIGGTRRLLVTEVKGQWHKELYTAASAQLYERYSIHPDAEQQGIFLTIWFGTDEKVAGRKKHNIGSAQELRIRIEANLSQALRGFIDVFVLDVSKPR